MTNAAKLKIKLDQWNLWLSGNDVNSITSQIGSMLWRSAFYRSINDSRRHLPDDGDGNIKANGPLHELINEGYETTLVILIRRLVDRGDISGPHGVYSLYGLVKDIKNHIALLTRANILAARGFEYNYGPIKQRAYDEARESARALGEKAYFISREGWAAVEYWHETWDKLCGNTATQRTSDDTPPEGKFGTLLEDLQMCGKKVQSYVDKYVAHNSSPESRLLANSQPLITLGEIWR